VVHHTGHQPQLANRLTLQLYFMRSSNMALTWQQHQQNIFAGESGGDYDALFGYQNRPDGIFSGIKVSEMPIADVIKFTSPSGAYGQYVKGQVGRVATPVGAYQVVGSTLRGAVEALGLDPSQKFDKATQDKIGQYILKTQGTGAWEGYGKGGAAMAQEPQKPQGLLGGLLGGQGIGGALGMSDDFRDKLKMAILAGTGDARMDPLIQATQARMEERRGEAKRSEQANKTVEFLKQRGRDDLAQAVLTGAIDPATAIQAAIAQPKEKTYQYQALAKDLLAQGIARSEKEALEMALSQTKAAPTINIGPTGIDYGKPPSDTAWQRDAEGNVVLDERGVPIALPIKNTKLFRDTEKVSTTEAAVKGQTVVSGGVVLGNIDKIRNVIESSILPTTGIVGQALRNLGGTAALDVNVLLRPIEASIGFERLQQMRDASPTGGALGQVTERELDLLKSTLGSLDQAQSEKQFLETLSQVETIYEGIIRKFDAYPPEAMAAAGYTPRLSNAPSSGQSGGATDEDLLKKYGAE
jgi:hypothetical protein